MNIMFAKPWCSLILLTMVLAWSVAAAGVTPAAAQAFMRAPNLNIGVRAINPTVAPTVTPRIAPSLSATSAIRPTFPSARLSSNRLPDCGVAERGADGACGDQRGSTAAGSGNGSKGKVRNAGASRGDASAAAGDANVIPGELVAEIGGNLSDAQTDALARRHGLRRIASQNVLLLGTTIGLFRITDRRLSATVIRDLQRDASIRSVQPNYRYLLQDEAVVPSEGDPAQYALAKLRLPQAHQLTDGAHVTIAVIDSGVDVSHPEFAHATIDTFDALGSKEGAHAHGTAIVGAIVSHALLMGGAPAARILAIRAFGTGAKEGKSRGAESSSFVILKALDYAASHGAQICNMSFAGPKDALIERAVAEVAAKGIVMVAAAGNAGATSPPLYPAANPHVIAVSATDARDQLLPASNRGNYVAIAAPGADVFLPVPSGKYQMISGTSFSAAYISSVAALVMARAPALKPDEVRDILSATAHDLGAPGRDDLFGAGEADAFAAVQAAVVRQPVSPAAVSAAPRDDQQHANVTEQTSERALPTMAAEKAGAADADVQPARQ